jgi:hypothetical protein
MSARQESATANAVPLSASGSDELLALADRCEKATGPDEALDLDIVKAVGWSEHRGWKREDGWRIPLPFTASLDAALTLVPEGWRPIIDTASEEEGVAIVDLWALPIASSKPLRKHAKAITPALALCAAALRARDEGGKS